MSNFRHIFHIKNNSADSNINPLSLTTLKAFLLPSTLYIIEPFIIENNFFYKIVKKLVKVLKIRYNKNEY